MKSANEIQLEHLKEDLKQCERRALAAKNQLRTELSDARKVDLEDIYEQILNSYRKIEHQIKKLESSLSYGWQDYLYQLDFNTADQALPPALKHLKQPSSCVFLMLKESRRMMGRYCVDRLEKEWLVKINRKIYSRTFLLEQVDEEGVLREFAKVTFPEQSALSISDFREVLKKLYDSYKNGILLIMIEFNDDLKYSPPEIFSRLKDHYFNQFQHFLVNEHNDSGPDQIVVLFISHNDIGSEYLDKSTFCSWNDSNCTWEGFDPSKIFIIPTELWDNNVLEQWISGKSGIELNKSDRAKIANDVITKANTGLPIDVDRVLQQVLSDYLDDKPTVTEQEQQG